MKKGGNEVGGWFLVGRCLDNGKEDLGGGEWVERLDCRVIEGM